MFRIKFFHYLPLTITLFCCCSRDSAIVQDPFDKVPVLYPVVAGVLDEASGIADSEANPGFLWVNQDSQQPAELYLLEKNGTIGKKIFVSGVTNRDWEEIALSTGPLAGKKYLYIGETGDNNLTFDEYIIYRMEEPAATMDTVRQVDRIRFKYPDGAHDSEAFVVDDLTKDIFIITKRETRSKVYKLSYPYSAATLNTASFVADLPYNGVVAAAYAYGQKELLVKTYDRIFYYNNASASIAELLNTEYKLVEYQLEPQGEAICFASDKSGFFTLSEKSFVTAVNLRFYKRN